MPTLIPQPLSDELPVDYAHRIAQWYLSWNRPDKALGQFFTPPPLARFMASMLPVSGETLHLLDPGSGMGILVCAVCETSRGSVTVEAFEVDNELVQYLDACLAYAQRWMSGQNRLLEYAIRCDDFILAHPRALDRSGEALFDAVITTPPLLQTA